MGTESTDVTACPDYFGAAQQWLEPTIMIWGEMLGAILRKKHNDAKKIFTLWTIGRKDANKKQTIEAESVRVCGETKL